MTKTTQTCPTCLGHLGGCATCGDKGFVYVGGLVRGPAPVVEHDHPWVGMTRAIQGPTDGYNIRPRNPAEIAEESDLEFLDALASSFGTRYEDLAADFNATHYRKS